MSDWHALVADSFLLFVISVKVIHERDEKCDTVTASQRYSATPSDLNLKKKRSRCVTLCDDVTVSRFFVVSL
jgi:hypothetical protein